MNFSVVLGKKDVLLFIFLMPLLLTFLWLLPSSVKSFLQLHTANPTLVSMFLSHYTHASLEHFIGNVLLYGIVVVLLFTTETDRKRFYLFSGGTFLLLPFISSSITTLFQTYFDTVLGFSAIVSAFIGYLLFSTTSKLKEMYGIEKPLYLYFWFICVNVLIVSITFFSIGSIVVLVALLSVLSFVVKGDLLLIVRKMQYGTVKDNHVMYRVLYLIQTLLILLFNFSLWILLPIHGVTGSSAINIFAHYIGWSFGIVFPLVITQLRF